MAQTHRSTARVRACQYTAVAYQEALAARTILPSISRVADYYDNAIAKRCFATRKTKLIDTQPWPTRQAIFAWVEVVCNGRRYHSALGYRSPATYEIALVKEMRAA